MLKRMFLHTGCLAILAFLGAISTAGGATLPSGFADQPVANVLRPTALAFTPDGRLLITQQTGQLRVYQNGALVTNPALDLTGRICNDSERGLLGVAVDPAFATNRYIYLYYTFNKFDTCEHNTPKSPVNRVSRFTLSGSNVAALR